MDTPLPRTKKKRPDEEVEAVRRRTTKPQRAKVKISKPKVNTKLAVKPHKVVQPKPIAVVERTLERQTETNSIISTINRGIDSFMDLVSRGKEPVNMQDLTYAAVEKRAGATRKFEGDYEALFTPAAIRETMNLAALLDQANAKNNSRVLERWGRMG